MASDDVVTWFRAVMGFDPSFEEIVSGRPIGGGVDDLRRRLFSRREFLENFPALVDTSAGDPRPAAREALVFLHIPKCAGTSLHHALLDHHAGAFCPERHNGLANWPAGLLAQYECFSGHFDIASLDLIPTKKKTLITLLRAPELRLISVYRFLRAHTDAAIDNQGENMELVRLARACDPVAFFHHPALAKHPSINNAMVRTLSGPLPYKRWEAWYPERPLAPTLTDRSPKRALTAALAALRRMKAFGVVEHLEESVAHIFAALGIEAPPALERRQATDVITGENPRLEPVESLELTPALAEAIAPHVSLDQTLYDRALGLLRERGVIPTP